MNIFTKEELKKFNQLSWACSSKNQLERISGRLALSKFIKEHGKNKCDAMWAEIQKRDENKA